MAEIGKPVICKKCGGCCYWDSENRFLVCANCSAKYEGEEFGREPLTEEGIHHG